MKLRILLLLCVITTAIYAQEEKFTTLKKVRGEFSIQLSISDITGREAVQRARDNAKRKALEEVCGSHISIWDQVEITDESESFTSLSVNQINGEVAEFVVREEGQTKSPNNESETIFYCVADITIKQGLPPDPDFKATVEGLKSVYIKNDILKFAILPHRDCYMKLFLMEDAETGYLLYPNIYDKSKILKGGQRIDITDSPSYVFELTKSSPAEKERNRLVFVFTKTECPFNSQVTSRAEIEKWIASIPNNQKTLYFTLIEIRDK
ncbi:MAG: hypothetical protein ACI4TR_01650 [Bacteroidaceae bacterium]